MSDIPMVNLADAEARATAVQLAGLGDARRWCIVRQLLISGSLVVAELCKYGLGSSRTVSAACCDLANRGLLETWDYQGKQLYAIHHRVKLHARSDHEWGGVRCGSVEVWFDKSNDRAPDTQGSGQPAAIVTRKRGKSHAA